MNEHIDELGEPIVQASTQAAMAYLGDPTAPDRPHYLETWAKYLRGLDPAHQPLITKELVDYWCMYGSPDDAPRADPADARQPAWTWSACSCPTRSPPSATSATSARPSSPAPDPARHHET